MKKENSSCSLKGIFVVIGALVSLAALAVVVYTIFKKYFKVTFECDGGCDDCDEGFCDPDEFWDPVCGDDDCDTDENEDAE